MKARVLREFARSETKGHVVTYRVGQVIDAPEQVVNGWLQTGYVEVVVEEAKTPKAVGGTKK